MPVNLNDISFFRDLSADELKRIQDCLREKNFAKGETLFIEGNICERVFFLKSGRVKLTRTSSSGREQILETLDAGDTCACNPCSSVWHCASTAVALTPCSAWFLSRDNYVKLVQNNMKLSQALNLLFAERLQCFSNLIEEVSLKDSRKRIAKFLLDMLKESKGKDSLVLPFTREELAQRLGATRETVARQLHHFKKERLIEIKPRQIIIKDKAKLEKIL